MAVPTVQVKTTINYSNGNAASGVHVIAELQSPSQTDDGYIVSKKIKGIVDINGDVTLNLWPNDLGIVGSFYLIEAYDEILGDLLKVVAVVPESPIPIDLEDIAMPVCSFSLANASGNVAGIRRVDTTGGITGGGDLTTNRTHSIDLTTITTNEPSPPGEWIVAVQNPAQPGQVRYARLGDLPGLGIDSVEQSTATPGQTVIFIEAAFSPNTYQLDVYIEGKYQCPDTYVESIVNIPPYNGKVIISEPLEGGEDICIKIKKSSPFSGGVDASQVTYSGGGSVEDALDTLFSTAAASPWQLITGNYTATLGDRLFISTDAGPITVTLPPLPSIGYSVNIIDITSSLFVGLGNQLINNITVNRNGSLMLELPENLIVDQARVSIEFIYSGPTIGWTFSE